MGLFSKLASGLAKTRDAFTGGLKSVFSGKVDEEFFDELEEALILACLLYTSSRAPVQSVVERWRM